MPNHPNTPADLGDARRLWLGEVRHDGRPQTRLFRRRFTLDTTPRAAVLRLFAEARFHVWINGTYLARGPILHHGHRLPVASHDLTALLRPGDNVVAVLVHAFGGALHNHVPTGLPGLVATLHLTRADGSLQQISTDAAWRATDRTGWSDDVPRRGWAIGHSEVFDAAAHPWGWTGTDFDDARWPAADAHDTALPPGGVFFADPLPSLRLTWQPAARLVSFAELRDPPPAIELSFRHRDYGEKLMQTAWHKPAAVSLSGDGPWTVSGLKPDRGAVLNLDLGAEYTGNIVLECLCPSTGAIDVGWSEYVDDDPCGVRPRIMQKGMSYVDRIVAAPGELRWMPIQFNAGRYLSIWFRGFSGDLKVRRAGMQATEPDLDVQAQFHCNDDALNRIWSLCARTQSVGTQEGLMDCPTREQAFYIGDGHPIARWIAQLTGDARHWRYLVREQFARQAPNGLIRSTPFSGRDDTLIDYTLIAIIGSRDYWRWTGDADAVRDLIEPCRRVLHWFDSHRDARGLFNWQWQGPSGGGQFWEAPYDPDRPVIDFCNLFIDHPGMGWHNQGEAGIDRHGINAAINALLVQAREAMAELEEAFGSLQRARELRDLAGQLRRAAHAAFFDPARGVYVDGEGLTQVSEQTHGWAVQARLCDDDTARKALRQVRNVHDTTIARAGPYFWFYLFPAMCGVGLHAEALRAAYHWLVMLDGRATTLWETFAGGDSDTACHPWSGAPVEFLLTHIAGLPWTAHAGQPVALRPRYDLLDAVEATIIAPAGPIDIAWRTDAAGRVRLHGRLPAGLAATLIAPDGRTLATVAGAWEHTT